MDGENVEIVWNYLRIWFHSNQWLRISTFVKINLLKCHPIIWSNFYLYVSVPIRYHGMSLRTKLFFSHQILTISSISKAGKAQKFILIIIRHFVFATYTKFWIFMTANFVREHAKICFIYLVRVLVSWFHEGEKKMSKSIVKCGLCNEFP